MLEPLEWDGKNASKAGLAQPSDIWTAGEFSGLFFA
jgi:hypothetical protein